MAVWSDISFDDDLDMDYEEPDLDDFFELESGLDDDSSDEPESNSNVQCAQLYLSALGYKVGAKERYGIMNNETRQSLIKYLQFQLGYYGAGCAITGEFDSDTLAKMRRFLPLAQKTPRTYLVKAIQLAVLCAGYSINNDNAINGIYSPELAQAVSLFQLDNDIPETGKIDSETFIALF